MDEHIFDKVQEVDMQKTMENYYIDYAMSVIASRALPDVRDGLKPLSHHRTYRSVYGGSLEFNASFDMFVLD